MTHSEKKNETEKAKFIGAHFEFYSHFVIIFTFSDIQNKQNKNRFERFICIRQWLLRKNKKTEGEKNPMPVSVK